MKNLKLFKGLAALLGTSMLFFCPGTFAHADFSGDLMSRCEDILLQGESPDSSLLDVLDELEDLKYGLSEAVQTQINSLVDKALAAEVSEERLWAEARGLLGDIIASIAPTSCPQTGDMTTCLGEVISNPQKLQAVKSYHTGDPHLRTVSIDPRALKEMERLDNLTIERLLRSVKKGFVPPVSGPGVVRLTDLHKQLVEVKIVKKGVTRLIGCIDAGHLYVKRVYHKRNEGRGGALGSYRDLCN